MSKHVKTPWTRDSLNINSWNGRRIAVINEDSMICQATAEANTKFIVKAVNCHDDMLDALNIIFENYSRDAKACKLMGSPHVQHALELARQAIAKAEG